jgi:phospholipase/lecithinase/hemolysin
MTPRFFPRTAFAHGLCAAGALLSVPADAYDAEYVFGDSLSDNGNLAALFGTTFPNPPSYNNSFTNGPVAVQLLAQSLGLSLNPSLWTTSPIAPAGTNYAVAGATSAEDPAGGSAGIDLPDQVTAYNVYASGAADPNALYVIMIGGNDVRDAALSGVGEPGEENAIDAGVEAEKVAISTLSGEGAKNFLIMNVPNVGLIPEFTQENPTLAATAMTLSQYYNMELANDLSGLDESLPDGTNLHEFDLYDYNASLLADATALGFTNTTDPCFIAAPESAATNPGCGVDGANIASYVYWNDIHPTARVQALWAAGFESAIPEPSTWAMLLTGFAGLAFAARRRARTAS